MKSQAKVKESALEEEVEQVAEAPAAKRDQQDSGASKEAKPEAAKSAELKPKSKKPHTSLKEHILGKRADTGRDAGPAAKSEPADSPKKPELKSILVRAEAAAAEELERRKQEQALDRTAVAPSARLEAAKAIVSVVVVTRHSSDALDACLAAVLSQTQPFELIVVDNGNAPEVTAGLFALADRDARVVLITGHGDVGYSKACNLGAKAAKGDYICILTPESILPRTALKDLVFEGLSLEKPWILGPKLITPEGFEKTGYRREKLTPWRAAVDALGLARFSSHPAFRGLSQPEETCPDETQEVPVLSGAPLMMPISDYWSIDGMNERYQEYLGSSDFCDRFADAGGRICFVPGLEVLQQPASETRRRSFAAYEKMKILPRYFISNRVKGYPLLVLWLGVAGSWALYGSLYCVLKAKELAVSTTRTMRRSLV